MSSTDPTAGGPDTSTKGPSARVVLRQIVPVPLGPLLLAHPGASRIGRDPSCELMLEDRRCSRFHARLEVRPAPRVDRPPRAILVDTGSRHGTWVNGARIAGPRALREHDKVGIGATVFTFQLLDEGELCAERALLDAALTDPLTGLLSRLAFEREVLLELTRSRRYGWPLALIMVDLDHFKRVNDTWGHAVGDEVLLRVSAAIRATRRETDHAGRIGGEEIAVAVPQTDLAGGIRVAERLRDTIRAVRVGTARGEVAVTASFGVVCATGGESSLPVLLACADAALYEAKARGRDRVVAWPLTETR